MEQAYPEFEAIGTRWQIACDIPADRRGAALQALMARIEAFDKAYSRFRPDSLVSRIAQAPGSYEMPEDWAPLWNLYRKLHEITDGAVTPLVGSLLEDLGYDAAYSFKPHAMRPVPNLEEACVYASPILTTKAPVLIDIGAAGKGYLVDIVSSILREHGATAYAIDAGGDILHHGAEPLRVGLEDPDDTTKAIGAIAIDTESICASAGNRRRWGDMHHIVDPRTGRSPERVVATWVIAKSALEADALATALFFTEPERFSEHFDFEWALMVGRSIRYSPRFEGSLFTGA